MTEASAGLIFLRFFAATHPLVFGAGAVHAQEHYYDLSATSDRRANFAFINELNAHPGGEALSDLPRDYLTYLVERMGHIDRFHATAEVLEEHLRLTREVEGRFYRDQPLGVEEIKRYLLPLRLRYESSARMGWKAFLRERMGEVLEGDSVDETAPRLFDWIGAEIELLEARETYRLPRRGDLDPVTTVRGGRGDEIAVTLLAVAALRTAGIAARVVWVPTCRGQEGGKVWAEYLDDGREWVPWVPHLQLAGGHEPSQHRRRLVERFSGAMPVVLARPEAPVAITSSYWPCGKVHVVPLAGDEEFQTSFLIRSGEDLFPLYGYDWKYPDGPNTLEATPGPLWVTAGYRTTKVLLERIEVDAEMPTWVGVDTREGKVVVVKSRERPEGFPEP